MKAWLGTSHVVVQVDRLESLLARFNTAFNMTWLLFKSVYQINHPYDKTLA